MKKKANKQTKALTQENSQALTKDNTLYGFKTIIIYLFIYLSPHMTAYTRNF